MAVPSFSQEVEEDDYDRFLGYNETYLYPSLDASTDRVGFDGEDTWSFVLYKLNTTVTDAYVYVGLDSLGGGGSAKAVLSSKMFVDDIWEGLDSVTFNKTVSDTGFMLNADSDDQFWKLDVIGSSDTAKVSVSKAWWKVVE